VKLNKLTTLIAISLIATLILVVLVRENQHLTQVENYLEVEIQRESSRLETYMEFTKNYNKLQASYDELKLKYNELEKTRGFYEGWEKADCFAYTSLDHGCNSYSAIGINIEKWSEYFNFCAVDPDGEIDYGDTILVKYNYDIMSFLAVDCGYDIKDKDGKKRLDLYFVNDLPNAFRFGERELDIKVIK